MNDGKEMKQESNVDEQAEARASQFLSTTTILSCNFVCGPCRATVDSREIIKVRAQQKLKSYFTSLEVSNGM